MNEPAEKRGSARPLIVLAMTAAVAAGVLIVRHVLPSPTSAARATAVGQPDKGKYSLNGIIRSKDNPVAVINGTAVREGDTLAGAEVVQILSDRVRLRAEGVEWTVSLPSIGHEESTALPMMLHLSSPRCGACKKMEPVIKSLKADYDGSFRVVYIDPWKNPSAGEKYGVTAIPTQIFYDKSGAELYRHVGFYSEGQILDTWRKLGIRL